MVYCAVGDALFDTAATAGGDPEPEGTSGATGGLPPRPGGARGSPARGLSSRSRYDCELDGGAERDVGRSLGSLATGAAASRREDDEDWGEEDEGWWGA